MLSDYEAYETKFGVLRMPEGYETVQEIFNKTKRAVLPWLLGFGGLIVSIIVLIWRRRKSRI